MRIVLLLTVLRTASAALPIAPRFNFVQARMEGDDEGGSATPEPVYRGRPHSEVGVYLASFCVPN